MRLGTYGIDAVRSKANNSKKVSASCAKSCPHMFNYHPANLQLTEAGKLQHSTSSAGPFVITCALLNSCSHSLEKESVKAKTVVEFASNDFR